MRSATPTIDPATAPKGSAPTRKTGAEQAIETEIVPESPTGHPTFLGSAHCHPSSNPVVSLGVLDNLQGLSSGLREWLAAPGRAGTCGSVLAMPTPKLEGDLLAVG